MSRDTTYPVVITHEGGSYVVTVAGHSKVFTHKADLTKAIVEYVPGIHPERLMETISQVDRGQVAERSFDLDNNRLEAFLAYSET